MYFIFIFLDWCFGFEATLQLKGSNLIALQNESHMRASISNIGHHEHACGVMLTCHHYRNFWINALNGDTQHLVISHPIVSLTSISLLIDWWCHAMILAYHSTTKHRWSTPIICCIIVFVSMCDFNFLKYHTFLGPPP